MPHYFEKALDSGVKAGELSEIIVHLAFYSGFPNAMAAINSAKDAFRKRPIGPEELPPVRDKLLPLNEKAESQRATQVANTFGPVSPGLVQTQPTFCSVTFGFAQLSHRATGVSSRSPL